MIFNFFSKLTVIRITAFIICATLDKPAFSNTIVKGEIVTEEEALKFLGSVEGIIIPITKTKVGRK